MTRPAFPAPQRLFGFVAVALVAAGLAMRLVGAFGLVDQDGYPHGPVSEDAYLSLQIAWNIGSGKGVTTAGEELTSGFQPLWVLLLAAFQWLFSLSKVSLARLALCLATVLSLATALLLARIFHGLASERYAALLAWAVAAIWMVDGLVSIYTLNGLETALALFAFATVLAVTIKVFPTERRPPSTKGTVLLAAAVALAFWARNDALLLAPFLVATIACRAFPYSDRPWRTTFRLTFAFVASLAILVSPWMLWNLMVSHSLQPQSGVAHSIFQYYSGGAIASYFVEHSYLFAHLLAWIGALLWTPLLYTRLLVWNPPFLALQGLAGIVLAAWLLFRDNRNLLRRILDSALWKLGPLLLSMPVLGATYLTYVSVRWFWNRYHAPFVVMSLIVTAFVVDTLLNSNRRRLRVLGIAVLAVTLAWHTATNLFYSPFQVTTDAGSHFRQLLWLRSNVPEGARVCSLQTGVIGYYGADEFQILNMDGKVNPAALAARLVPGELPKFISRECDYFIEWAWALDRDELAPLRDLCEPYGAVTDEVREEYSSEVVKCPGSALIGRGRADSGSPARSPI